jgi:hypothetical protein
MAALTLVIYMAWNIHINVNVKGSHLHSHFTVPEVSWSYYAVFTGLVFALIVLLLRRLLTAWKKRSRNAASG